MNDAYRARQLEHIREVLAENERSHTPEEVAAAIELATEDSRRLLVEPG